MLDGEIAMDQNRSVAPAPLAQGTRLDVGKARLAVARAAVVLFRRALRAHRLWTTAAALVAPMACTRVPAPKQADAARAVPEAEARAFFDRFAELWGRADRAVAALYDDDAIITSVRHEGKTTKNVEVPGKTWKAVLAELLPVARATGEAVVFTNVAAEAHGETVRITAHRYSTSRCWLDPDYRVDLARDRAGALRVVGEVSLSFPDAQCGVGKGKTLDQRLDELAGQMARALPVQLDPDTRLDAVRRGQTELRFELTLVHLLDVSQIDLPRLTALLHQRVLDDTCHRKSVLRAVLDDGGQVSYRYADLSGQALLKVTIDAGSCPAG